MEKERTMQQNMQQLLAEMNADQPKTKANQEDLLAGMKEMNAN
jgi:ABC-type transporter MlaC component